MLHPLETMLFIKRNILFAFRHSLNVKEQLLYLFLGKSLFFSI